jgi:UDP-N-acetylmuramyl tripeptide synthase
MRRTAAVAAAKITAGLSRRFRFGGGTALPGLVAERIDPDVITELAAGLGQGSVLITGTNGKTTTARLLRSAAAAAGIETVANRAGSNMMRGIAASLTQAVGWGGDFQSAENLLGVFEVDEATMPEAAWEVKPRAAVFTNLFRDQLDRYGEVDYVASVWRGAVETWPDVATLVLNADDPSVASLGELATGKVMYFGVEDTSIAGDGLEHAADARWCPACGMELEYGAVFYGHLGHWRCPSCWRTRAMPDVACTRVTREGDQQRLLITLPGGAIEVKLPLAGTYNVYNALAAACAAQAIGIDAATIASGLQSFTAAFGRQEVLQIHDRQVQVLLAKNPAGFNQVIRTITQSDGASPLHIVMFLNDGIADGRDISWIWDVDFELLSGRAAGITVSGNRAWDMALRLKYAGLEPVMTVDKDPAEALRRALEATPPGQSLHVVPTYTAMLEVRDLLARWAGGGAFWEQD